MTLPSGPEYNDCSQQFQTDFTQLAKDAIQYNKDYTAEGTAATNLQQEVDSLANEFQGHPGELLAVIIIKVLGSRRDQVYQSQLKTNADAVQIQGDVTKLTNDIQNTINDKSTSNTDVQYVAAETDEMQNVFGASASSSVASWASYISGGNGAGPGAIGSTAAGFLDQNFKAMRDDIDWTTDPEESTYNTQSSAAHFEVGGAGINHLSSYSEMFNDLSQQGDPKGAQEANKIILDNYNQNISTTQSLGTAANTEIGLITSAIKMNTSATSDFVQDILTGNRTAVNNQLSRG